MIDLKTIKDIKERVDESFRWMNQYASDPYNMGGDAHLLSRILPTDVLAQVYMILAPASNELALILSEIDNDRCLVCGALKVTHENTHLCRMHRDRNGKCLVCGKVKP
jgi:hypothetical protein